MLFKVRDTSLPWRKVRRIINQSVRETENARSEDAVDQRLMAQRHRLQGQAMGIITGDGEEDTENGDIAGPAPDDIILAPRARRSAAAAEAPKVGGKQANNQSKSRAAGSKQTQDADGGEGGGASKTPKKAGRDAASVKGRKKTNYSEHILKSLKQLKDCAGSEPKFFGNEWKNLKRNWDYYIVGMEEAIQTEEDMTVLEGMESCLAIVKSARKVLLTINLHGMTAKSSVSTFVEELRWLQRCGHDVPFPIFLVKQMKTAQCLNVTDACHFWRLLQRLAHEIFNLLI